MKILIYIVILAYFGIAVTTSVTMSSAIPAMNWTGATYAGVTWPLSVGCELVKADSCFHIEGLPDSVMEKFFTFEEK